MSNQLKLRAKEIDVDQLVFMERYVTNLLKWDLLAFFGSHPVEQKNASEIAKAVGRSLSVVRLELGDLAILNLLRKSNGHSQPVYELTHNSILRNQIIKFARQHLDAPGVS